MFASANSQVVTSTIEIPTPEYVPAITGPGPAGQPSVWSIEGQREAAVELPFDLIDSNIPSLELCTVSVTTYGSPVYVFGQAQFRLVDDDRANVGTLLTRNGQFIGSERLAGRLGETTLVTLSVLDRPHPGRHVYSILAARLTEVPVVASRCSVTAYEFIE
jgi:hypothetical protein